MTEKNNDNIECPFCSETIKASAKFCRFCKKDLVSSEAKNKLAKGCLFLGCGLPMLLAGLFFLFIIIGFFYTSNTSKNTNTVASTQESISTSTKKSVKNQEPEIIRIGDSFSVGDLAYKIKKPKMKKRVGNSYMNATAESEAIFYIVPFEVQNNGNKTTTVITDNFQLIDANGTKFDPDSNAVTTYAMTTSKNHDWLLSQLQPKIIKHSATIFRIPISSAKGHLQLHVPANGLFDTSEAFVRLQ